VRPPTGLVIALAALAAFPALPLAGAPVAPAAAPNPVALGDALLPPALAVPWADRSGFDPAHLLELPAATPAVGDVRVAVTLWPTDRAMFLPPAPGRPPVDSATIADRYGPTPMALAALDRYFTGHGLVVEQTSPDRLGLTLVGPADRMGAAFGTRILAGTWEGRPVHFPASVPTLPSPFASEVAALSGLADGFNRFQFSLTPLPVVTGPAQGRTSSFITPSAAHLLYGLSGLYNLSGSPRYATGTGIAVVLWGDGYDPADLQTFFSTYYPAGFPAISVGYVNVDGAPAPSASAVNDPSMAPQELTLDLEWAGSAAPGATLTAVYAPDGPSSNGYSPTDATLEDALRAAVGLSGVDVVSMSFGTPDGGDPALQAAFSMTLASAAQKGITVLAATGDTGGAVKSGCQGGAAADFPATSPDVLAVGGTAPVESLDALGDVVGLDSEPAWNGSGGGYSSSYAAPTWQTQTVPSIQQHGGRAIPDVSGPAYDNFFFFGGGERAGRGTSFATPMWAGLVAEMDALLGHPLGTVAPRFYAAGPEIAAGASPAGLVDITSGANCIASAGTGWDAATGWGSPRGVPLFADLSSSFVTVGLSASAGSVAPGGSFTATASIRNSSTHAPLGGLDVAFSLTAPGYSGPCGGTLATAGGTTDPTGNASATLSVPGCFLGSSVLLTVTIVSGGYFGMQSTSVGVNLVGLAGFLAFIQVFPYNVLTFIVLILLAVGIGYWIGERRRPRRRRLPATGPSVGAPGPGPGALTAAGPPPAAPASPPPAPGVPAVESSPDLSVGFAERPVEPPPVEVVPEPIVVSVPDHVLAPPSAAPPLVLPAVEVHRCPRCEAAVGPEARSCPDCGYDLAPPDAATSGS
jgi:kumamolisin